MTFAFMTFETMDVVPLMRELERANEGQGWDIDVTAPGNGEVVVRCDSDLPLARLLLEICDRVTYTRVVIRPEERPDDPETDEWESQATAVTTRAVERAGPPDTEPWALTVTLSQGEYEEAVKDFRAWYDRLYGEPDFRDGDRQIVLVGERRALVEMARAYALWPSAQINFRPVAPSAPGAAACAQAMGHTGPRETRDAYSASQEDRPTAWELRIAAPEPGEYETLATRLRLWGSWPGFRMEENAETRSIRIISTDRPLVTEMASTAMGSRTFTSLHVTLSERPANPGTGESEG